MGARNDQHVFIHKKDPSQKILSYRVALLNCCLLTALLARHVSGQSAAPSPVQSASAANLAEEVRLLRAEVSELRAELDGLRQIVKGHQTETNQIADSTTGAAISGASTRTIQPNQSGAPSAAPQETATPSNLGIIQSQVAELAQTKAESNSKMALKIYGTILSTTFFNSRGVDWADQPV